MRGEDAVKAFIEDVKMIHERGRETENSFRPALKTLLESIRIESDIVAINEPKAEKCGAVDFRVFTKKTDLLIGCLEAKKIDIDVRKLKSKQNREQFERYSKAYPNLIYTNCCDWDFYRNGKRVESVCVPELSLGLQLRRLHLMDDEVIGETPYSFVNVRVKSSGSDEVTKPKHDGEHVWINDDKRFENVPIEAWELYIGGYQPAQKWLKDRKGRDLSFEDTIHYQKIIKILCETHRIMDSYESD